MQPNVVIIIIDAVRAQNLSIYGYPRQTTPFLSSIEKELAVYENAISSSYWTMPAIASLFTGMYTSGHKLLVDGDKLSKSLASLPSVLRKRGYRCAAFTRNIYVSEYSGLDTHFHDFFSRCFIDHLKAFRKSFFPKSTVPRFQRLGIRRKYLARFDQPCRPRKPFSTTFARLFDVISDSGGMRFVKDFSKWLKQFNGQPFFAYFHFLETHSPYRCSYRFALSFLKFQEHLRRLSFDYDHTEFLSKRFEMSQSDLNILIKSYDSSIIYLDYLIKKIANLLRRHNVYDNTLFVILSDHGENIGDHGLMFHYFCLYDTLIKVPLLIKYPSNLAVTGRLEEIAQNVDIFPTVLTMLDEKSEDIWSQVQGNDLLGQAPSRREPHIAISELIKVFGPNRSACKDEFKKFDRRLLSVRAKDRKFIYSSRGDHECYDLVRDPNETHNYYPEDDSFSELMQIASKYYQRMNEFYMSRKEDIDGEINGDKLDSFIRKRLESLGYM